MPEFKNFYALEGNVEITLTCAEGEGAALLTYRGGKDNDLSTESLRRIGQLFLEAAAWSGCVAIDKEGEA